MGWSRFRRLQIARCSQNGALPHPFGICRRIARVAGNGDRVRADDGGARALLFDRAGDSIFPPTFKKVIP
jgi:hypothetical protein